MSQFVKNIEDIKLGVKVENDTYFDAVDPYLIAAERDYLLPYLGEELNAAIQAEGYDTTKFSLIANQIKIAVSCFAFYHIIQEGSLRINEHGAAQAIGDMTSQPTKWRDDNQKSELIKRGDKALDALLDILMDNITQFIEWKSSKWYALRTSLIISKASDFNEFVPICSSTRVFLRLLPDLKKAQRLLNGLICDDLTKRITDNIETPEASQDWMESLYPYLAAVLSYETITRAIMRFNFFITPDGILFYSISDSTFSKMSASHADKKDLHQQYIKNLDEARAELLAFLRANPDDYPEYASSPCSGQKSSSKPFYAFDNKRDNKFFSP